MKLRDGKNPFSASRGIVESDKPLEPRQIPA
jgi:hypothetical protein